MGLNAGLDCKSLAGGNFVASRGKIMRNSNRRLAAVENLESRLLLTAAALEGLTTGATLVLGNNAVVISDGGDSTAAESAIQQFVIENGLAGGTVINNSGSLISNYASANGLGIAYADGSDSGILQSRLINYELHGQLTATPATKPARHLVFKESSVGNGTAGSDLSSIIVKIENAKDKVVTTGDATITLSVASGPGTIKGKVSVQAVDGKATFSNIKLDTAGDYTLSASDAGGATGTSGSFTIAHAAKAKLVFASSISTPQAEGAVITPPIVVDVEDAFGNIITGATSAVTLGVEGSKTSTELGGTLTVNAVAGQATFSDITIDQIGTLELKATHGKLTKAVSTSITVS